MVFCLKNIVVMDIVKLIYCIVNSMDKYVIVFINGVCFRFKWVCEEFIKVFIMFWFFM